MNGSRRTEICVSESRKHGQVLGNTSEVAKVTQDSVARRSVHRIPETPRECSRFVDRCRRLLKASQRLRMSLEGAGR